MTVRLQNLQHSLDTTTSELEQSKLEIKQCHEMIEKERSLREKIEEALQNQAKYSAEYHKKTTLQFDQIYARVRTTEENLEKSEERWYSYVEETMKQKKFDNGEIQKRMDDIEKELNNLQEKSFNGELVTNKSRRSQEQLPSSEACCTTPDPAVYNAENNRPQQKKIFRAIKPVGYTIIWGIPTPGAWGEDD